ncbi:electron transfer flavoprotein alpha subunit [Actinoplanes tereljensis]|uniref:Electron transfer flavoprotein subunit alpha n=1 Tax=Paractinoplanes tereljensis TaxID=571912 RepID=A0A919TUP4_9ACTN|nr:electron transfer flavoprotein subunit alpha/FixB family protein [Actinoplanes tereljensis]GIF23046.1 electron transfer flavoprotein subunit alpha [Actinoplanes tereljensis]
MAEVLVLAEQGGTSVHRATCALLTLARRLGVPAAVVGGSPDPAGTAVLGRFGARTIYPVTAAEVDEHPVAARVEMLVHLARRNRPAAILIASGRDGLEIAGRVAVRLDSGLLSDVIDVTDGPVVVQSVQGGAYRVESSVVRGIPILAVRTEYVTVVPAPAKPRVSPVRVPFPDRVRAVRMIARDRTRPRELSTAAVIVAGGRGVGSRAGFELVRQLAAALDGLPAGSHAAAEQGWCPPEMQVDQVGTIVHPSLYLALGISGSMRHRTAMRGAATIVAIDSDPQAPIFQLSDLGGVGDVHKVVPELIAEIERRRAQPRIVEG